MLLRKKSQLNTVSRTGFEKEEQKIFSAGMGVRGREGGGRDCWGWTLICGDRCAENTPQTHANFVLS